MAVLTQSHPPQKTGCEGHRLLVGLLLGCALTAPVFAVEFQLQPVSQNVVIGDTLILSVAATGTPPVTYQWYHDDDLVPGATNAVLTFVNVQYHQGGDYQVVVTDAVESVGSSVVNVFVSAPTGSNPQPIVMPREHRADPYPSIIRVRGMTGSVFRVTVTLSGMRLRSNEDMHVLLAGPGGQAVVLMANVGEDESDWNIMLTFGDEAGRFLPHYDHIQSGFYRPTTYGTFQFSSPAPAGPYSANFSIFNGVDPNGNWKLYLEDADTKGA